MTKTLVWIVVGVLAAAGIALLAVTELTPKAEPAAAAAAPVSPATTTAAKGGAEPVAVAAPTPSPAPAASPPASAPAAFVRKTSPTVDELIQNAAAYDGAPVSLAGVILTQCTAGCEFSLSDDTGVLSIQLEGKGKDRLLPLGKVGKKIAIQGVFHASPRPQVVVDDPNGWQFVK